MQQLEEEIDRILANSPYSMAPSEKEPILLELLKEELDRGSRSHAGYRNYLEHCPADYRCADRVSDFLEQPADWKALEAFAEYGGWHPERVTWALTQGHRVTFS